MRIVTLLLALILSIPVGFSQELKWSFTTGQSDHSLIPIIMESDITVIKEGTGGSLQGMSETLITLLLNKDRMVIIDGPCYSACTLLLSMPNTMFTKNASFFYHSVGTDVCIRGELTRKMSYTGNKRFFNMLMPKQQDWVARNHALASFDFTEMTFEEAAKLYPARVIDANLIPEISADSFETDTRVPERVVPSCKSTN